MTLKLRDLFTDLRVLKPVQTGRLQVFGLRRAFPGDLDYTTLDEALASGLLEVTESSKAGSVPELLVINKSDRLILLLAGELLVGAKQNRTLDASLLVPARGQLVVPVSCVERGRWHYTAPTFKDVGERSHPKLRREVTAQAHDRYRTEGRPGSDQGAVWDEVDRKLRALGSASQSASLHQVYEDRRTQLDAAVRSVRLPHACNGVAFALGGRVVGVELFDKPATLAKAWPKLLRAQVMDALEQAEQAQAQPTEAPARPGWRDRLGRWLFQSDSGGPADGTPRQDCLNRRAVTRWLRAAAEVDWEAFNSPGVGADLRSRTNDLVGASLTVEGRPVHTELFATVD